MKIQIGNNLIETNIDEIELDENEIEEIVDKNYYRIIEALIKDRKKLALALSYYNFSFDDKLYDEIINDLENRVKSIKDSKIFETLKDQASKLNEDEFKALETIDFANVNLEKTIGEIENELTRLRVDKNWKKLYEIDMRLNIIESNLTTLINLIGMQVGVAELMAIVDNFIDKLDPKFKKIIDDIFGKLIDKEEKNE